MFGPHRIWGCEIRGNQLTQHTQKTGQEPVSPRRGGGAAGIVRMYAGMVLPKSQGLRSRLGTLLGPHPVVRSPQTGQEPMCWRKPLERAGVRQGRGSGLRDPGDLSSPRALTVPSTAQHGGASLPEPPTVGWGCVEDLPCMRSQPLAIPARQLGLRAVEQCPLWGQVTPHRD